MQAASGISGFPANEVVNSDANGISTFSFQPSANPTFVNNRQTTCTSGSTTPNTPVFDIVAEVYNGTTPSISQLSETSLNQLVQDETDILRQEYVDFQIPVPDRSLVVPSLGAGYNRGNYQVQLSVDLPTYYQNVLLAYQNSQITIGTNTFTMPPNTSLTISSGFRNPRRNIAIGSVHSNSKHTQGRALDLVPVMPVEVMVNGVRTPLSLHGNLYPALFAAASTQGTAIAEQGATPVTVGSTQENHVHVQW